MSALHAVLCPLSMRLARRQRFAAAREALAEALAASGALAGAPRALPYSAWPREASGAPAVVRGWHASVTDTRGLAAALVAPFAVALDAEWRQRPRWHAARERFRVTGELAQLGDEGRDSVLALWSAKEALLKLTRTGLADLARCPLLARASAGAQQVFNLRHGEREYAVRVQLLGQHLLAHASAAPVALELHALQEVA